MGRGLFFGAFWGFVVGGAVLAVASLLGEGPGQNNGNTAPSADVVEVPAGSAFDTAKEDVPAEVPTVSEEAPEAGNAPMVDAPVAPPAPALGSDVTASADVPITGTVQELAPPPETPRDSGVTVQLEAPAVPEVTPEDTTSLPAAEAETSTADLAPATETAPEPAAQPEVEPAPEETVVGEAAPEPAPEPVPEPAPGPAPIEEDSVANATPEPEVNADEPVVETALSDEPEPVARPQANAGGFGDLASNVTTNRLPSIGDDTDAPSADPVRAIEEHAVTDRWSGPDERPLVSIILIDEDANAAALPALQSFDGPLTFALPAGRADAVQAMQAYRAAGHEVALIADLPPGAAPADVEIAFETYLQSVPNAATVLDGSLNGFGGDRRVVGQVAEILAGTGHGLVTFEQGLNSTAQTTRRAGVPTETVFRDLDGNGQDARVITRFLDQAAFRAGQEGQVILLARMKADTISALLIWSQQDRASRVNLAPASAVLLAGEAQ